MTDIFCQLLFPPLKYTFGRSTFSSACFAGPSFQQQHSSDITDITDIIYITFGRILQCCETVRNGNKTQSPALRKAELDLNKQCLVF